MLCREASKAITTQRRTYSSSLEKLQGRDRSTSCLWSMAKIVVSQRQHCSCRNCIVFCPSVPSLHASTSEKPWRKGYFALAYLMSPSIRMLVSNRYAARQTSCCGLSVKAQRAKDVSSPGCTRQPPSNATELLSCENLSLGRGSSMTSWSATQPLV
jgi:Pyruvate/2-oxoacid:ferredoxin oxidoreductase delta subunit